MHTYSIRQLTTRTTFLLTLGLSLGLGACDKMVEVTPANSIDASTGLRTPQDIAAGLRGAYDGLQSVNYLGLRYQLFADLSADNARHTGTFPSFAQIAQNQILPDNVEISNMWNSIYASINRANYVIQQAPLVTDPSFNPTSVIAEARALRAFHYMNLLGYWGGTPQGYGYPDGLGVPLRLTPTTNISDGAIDPIPRASEAEVAAAIRDDLTFAAANTTGVQSTISKVAALALRARFELRMRNYADALTYVNQAIGGATATVSLEAFYENIFSQKFSGESIWELPFDAVDSNSLAFFWLPASRGGRGEVAYATNLPTAHEAGDLRRPVNAVAGATTTRKYFRIATNDDNVILVRGAELLLTRAEANARLGQLAAAVTDLNRIRARAGLSAYALILTATDPTGQNGLINQILRDRRIEFANEGLRWFDLRRTNTVQAVRTDVTQTFRNLWPIPLREVQNSRSLVIQNPGY